MKTRGHKAQPLVSVIIPTYNRPALLKRAVLSAQEQTYQNLEIIIVDDASNDDTENVVRGFNDNRIKYVKHNTNRGGSAARNTGIETSRGEYIAFLDDDDEWVESKIERQLKDISGYDAVLCSTTIVGKARSVKRYKKAIVDVKNLRKGFVFSGGTNIILGKSEVLRQVKFDESLNKSQDWDLLIRLAGKFSVRYVNEPLVIYHNEDHERITNKLLTMPIEEINNHLGIIHKHRDFLGSYWCQYHIAGRILAYIGKRENKLPYITYAIKRCGPIPVFRVLADKLLSQLKSYT